jgi:hypothetical protein
MNKLSYFLSVSALSLLFAASVVAQNPPQKITLVMNGHANDGAVAQIGGRSYVDVETLARILNATISFKPGRVILTGPAVEAIANPERTVPAFSKEFAKAGIAQLAEMREWKGAISSAIRSGVAGGNWLAPLLKEHRGRAAEGLSQASVAAKTESDLRALELLKSEFTNLAEWDTESQATIQSLNAEKSLNPPAAQNDPLLAKISECGSFLNAMLVEASSRTVPVATEPRRV